MQQASLYSLHMTSETTGWGLILGGNEEYRVIQIHDSGQSWKASRIWKLDQSDHLDFFPLSEQMALALAGQRVYRTIDAGATWQEGSLPLATNKGSYVRSLTFPDAQHGWLLLQTQTLGMSSHLLLSTEDGGRNFRYVMRFKGQTPPAPGISGQRDTCTYGHDADTKLFSRFRFLF